MPMKRANYPANWEELRAVVATRSGGRCEALTADGSRCLVRNGEDVHRRRSNAEVVLFCTGICGGVDTTDSEYADPIRVVLTVAHLCQDSRCDDITHLSHQCQLHHLRLDAKQHGANAAATRRTRKQAVPS